MPNRDGTGPNGRGPMTGRKLGRCGGRGRNFNNMSTNLTRTEEIEMLKKEKENIEKRMKDLE